MRGAALAVAVACVSIALSGCGGGGGAAGSLPDARNERAVVGPFVIQPAAATSMQIQTLPTTYGASFAVFTGVTIDYVAVRELMDRIAFSTSATGVQHIAISDFFGGNITLVTSGSEADHRPAWSPDGSMIAWSRQVAGSDWEIFVMPASGGTARNLTNNGAVDQHPTWSPDGRWIAFETDREGDADIYKVLVDGSSQTAVTSDAGPTYQDREPDWSPKTSKILLISDPTGSNQVCTIDANGLNFQQVVTSNGQDSLPAWHPDGNQFASCRWGPPLYTSEIYTNDLTGTNDELAVTSATWDSNPCYSSDGKYLFFSARRDHSWDSIWAKQTEFPYRLYRILSRDAVDTEPDLGSPTVQISRVLVGPAGSDHGYDPIHNAAVAGVVAFNADGYLNFVRLGIPPASGASLTATPLEDAGFQLVGVILSGPDMYYLEEDDGLGAPPIMWSFTSAPIRTAVLYLDAYTGKLAAVMDMGDSIHTASAGDSAAVITHDPSGPGTVIRGSFRRVWDAHGRLVAEGDLGLIELDGAKRVARAF